MMARELIYLDHAAATPVRDEALAAMAPYQQQAFGNPASTYGLAREARRALETARERVAATINARPNEVIFTSGGAEGNNLAIFGVLAGPRAHEPKLVISAVEHLSVTEPAHAAARLGVGLSVCKVDHEGLIDVDAVAGALGRGFEAAPAPAQTTLVSVGLANNEIGVVQPIADLTRAIKMRAPSALVHTDACVAAGYLDLDVERLGVDLMTLSSQKIYGPKGVGALYLRRNLPFAPRQYGGPHERGRRAGSENVPGIVGFAEALALAQTEREANRARDLEFSQRLADRLLAALPTAQLVGPLDPTRRLPNNLALVFPDLDGEMILAELDRLNLAASSGAACASASLEPSPTLVAIGLPPRLAHGSLRLTCGRLNTRAQVDDAADRIIAAVRRAQAFVGDR